MVGEQDIGKPTLQLITVYNFNSRESDTQTPIYTYTYIYIHIYIYNVLIASLFYSLTIYHIVCFEFFLMLLDLVT